MWIEIFRVQRGHQNSLEMMPIFFILMILGGIRHPVICSSLGVAYSVSRFYYFKGYSTGDPQKRLSIGFVSFIHFALIGIQNLWLMVLHSKYEYISFLYSWYVQLSCFTSIMFNMHIVSGKLTWILVSFFNQLIHYCRHWVVHIISFLMGFGPKARIAKWIFNL